MSAKLFEAALGITDPWFINGVDFDAGKTGGRLGLPAALRSRPNTKFISSVPMNFLSLLKPAIEVLLAIRSHKNLLLSLITISFQKSSLWHARCSVINRHARKTQCKG